MTAAAYGAGRTRRRGASARAIRAAGTIALSSLVTLIASLPANATSGHEQIGGSGSSWAALAVQQWVSDESSSMQVVYTPSGSAQGRTDFANGQNDFAVSDIGYQGQNKQTGVSDSSNRPYAYLPIVGGATAFPYNIVVAGQRVQNLRLSGLTLAKIFTDQITNWDDPAITADNNGQALPSIPIIPVIHSEGAGTTFQFTDYLNTEYPQLWHTFSSYSFPVEFWPTGQGSQVAENGSDGVMGFIASAAGQGSIGYDEYAYAIGAQYPVVALENTAGYFTMPDAYDAAVSLTQAHINYDPNPADCSNLGFNTSPCYLLEKLDNVYTYHDPRTYPLSSYSYEILPTAPTCTGPTSQCDPTMNTAKRQTLADFDNFSLCAGQSQMAPIGYSPLPVNLVEDAFRQVTLLHKADPAVVIAQLNPAHCNNPTFIPGEPSQNYLAKIAPYPPACAKAGQGPCPGQYAHNGNPRSGIVPTTTTTTTSTTTSTTTTTTTTTQPKKPGGGTTTTTTTQPKPGGGTTTTTTTTTQPKKPGGGTTTTTTTQPKPGGGTTTTTTTTTQPTNPGGGSTTTTTTTQPKPGGGSTTTTTAASSGTSTTTTTSTSIATTTTTSVPATTTTSTVVPLAVATVLAGDHPGGLGYIALGLAVTALIVVGLCAPALLRSARRRLRRPGSGR
jgi:ABC-type phosphate transport system substrate-binding protein